MSILFSVLFSVSTLMSAQNTVETILLIRGAADTACAESGRDYKDGAHVLQVVRNHAALFYKGWKRYDGTLKNALYSPAQHAHGCRYPTTLGHYILGIQFVADALPVEPWAKSAISYCNIEPEGTCENRCKGGCPYLGKVVHRYYGLTQKHGKKPLLKGGS